MSEIEKLDSQVKLTASYSNLRCLSYTQELRQDEIASLINIVASLEHLTTSKIEKMESKVKLTMSYSNLRC
jgi:hypothetical protein